MLERGAGPALGSAWSPAGGSGVSWLRATGRAHSSSPHSLISTDATARGIDVRAVQLVVNYDAPQYLRTYVHRVGRTARAGNTGQAFTLLLRVQEKRFLRMLAEAGAPELQRHDVPAELLQPLVPRYEEALSQLESAIKEEQRQKAA